MILPRVLRSFLLAVKRERAKNPCPCKHSNTETMTRLMTPLLSKSRWTVISDHIELIRRTARLVAVISDHVWINLATKMPIFISWKMWFWCSPDFISILHYHSLETSKVTMADSNGIDLSPIMAPIFFGTEALTSENHFAKVPRIQVSSCQRGERRR